MIRILVDVIGQSFAIFGSAVHASTSFENALRLFRGSEFMRQENRIRVIDKDHGPMVHAAKDDLLKICRYTSNELKSKPWSADKFDLIRDLVSVDEELKESQFTRLRNMLCHAVWVDRGDTLVFMHVRRDAWDLLDENWTVKGPKETAVYKPALLKRSQEIFEAGLLISETLPSTLQRQAFPTIR